MLEIFEYSFCPFLIKHRFKYINVLEIFEDIHFTFFRELIGVEKRHRQKFINGGLIIS